MSYAFEIKGVFGGYAYYGTYTNCDEMRGRFEFRVPSEVDDVRFAQALSELGLPLLKVDSETSYRRWLYTQGWAIIGRDLARRIMPKWLAGRPCIQTPLGSFTDTELCSPSILARGLRGRRRRSILERDGKKCLMCGAEEALTIQHVRPYSKEGETGWRNLVTLCEPCNQQLADELHWGLYDMADLPHSIEPSLTKHSDLGFNALVRGSELSSNLMFSRCEV